MQNCEVVAVRFAPLLQPKIREVFERIKQDYAIVSLIEKSSDLLQQILMFKNRITLRKRKIYLIVLVGEDQLNLPIKEHTLLYFRHEDSKFTLQEIQAKRGKENQKILDIEGSLDFQELRQGIVRLLQLDFIWLGFLSRLGSSIKDLAHQLTTNENFMQMEIGHEVYFLQELNKCLGRGMGLQEALQLTQQHLKDFQQEVNDRVQIHVREKFNSRFLIKHITYTKYFRLLLSRNYFHLLLIECPTLQRFQNFKGTVGKYTNIGAILTLQSFVQIDDYWYSTAIQKCVPHARHTINRMIQKQPYSQLIKKYYSKIIRHFRPNFDQYFISICLVLKSRSGCIKEAVGSIIVKEKRIIATGYNGTPVDVINCFNGGCKVCNNSESINTEILSCNCIHAEYSCILEAGIKVTPGCTLYTSGLPCLWCTKLIIQAKISKVVYLETTYKKLKHQNQDLVYEAFKNARIQLKEVTHDGNVLSE